MTNDVTTQVIPRAGTWGCSRRTERVRGKCVSLSEHPRTNGCPARKILAQVQKDWLAMRGTLEKTECYLWGQCLTLPNNHQVPTCPSTAKFSTSISKLKAQKRAWILQEFGVDVKYIHRPASRCYRELAVLDSCLMTEVLSANGVLILFLSREKGNQICPGVTFLRATVPHWK